SNANYLLLLSFPTRRSSDLGARRAHRRRAGDRSADAQRDLTPAVRCRRPGPPCARERRARSSLGWTCPPTPGGPVTDLLPDLRRDRKSTRLNSSHVKISYAV